MPLFNSKSEIVLGAGMKDNSFEKQIEATLESIVRLEQQASALPEEQKAVFSDAMEELSVTLEELQVAGEELHQQNEELASTRLAVETERQRYQELFNFAPDGYLVTDTSGVILEANRAISGLLNVSQGFLAGKPLAVYVAEEERSSFHLRVARLAGMDRIDDWEVRLQPREGKPFFAAITVNAFNNLEGKRIGLHWLIRDITTERMRREAAIVHLASFPELNPNPIVELDLTGRIYYLNPAARDLFPDLEVKGLQHPWLKGLEGTTDLFEQKGNTSHVRELKIGDSWFEQNIHYVFEDQRLRIYGSDITERKRMEEELRRSRDELEIRVQQRTIELSKINEELKNEIEERWRTEEALRKRTRDLNDRIREINCLHSISREIGKQYARLDEKLQGIVELLPSGWQYPDITCARIVLKGKDYKTGNFRETPWKQASDITDKCEKLGWVEVYYLEEKRAADEGPFLKEERGLINSIAVELGEMVGHMWADEELNKAANIIENAGFGVAIGNPAGKTMEFVNPEYARQHGYTQTEMIGMPYDHVYAPESKTALDDYIKRADEEGRFSFESRHVRKDGGGFPVLMNVRSVKDETGKVRYRVVFCQDISEMKEASLYARSLIEASLDPMVTISRDGKILDVNRGTEQVTGVYRESLIGSDFSNYFTEPEKARMGYQQVFRNGFVRDYPLAIRHTSGRLTEVLYNATLYRNEAGEIQGVFAAARDITEHKRMEDRLLDSEARLRHLSSQLITVQENERNRIALEIHDSLGQSLNAIKFKVSGAMQDLLSHRTETGLKHFEDLLPIVQEGIEEARRLQMDLRPPILDDLGISATISWFCRQFQKTYANIRIEPLIDFDEKAAPKSLKIVIYRVLQEAMNNVAKHSGASLVSLSLTQEKNRVALTIQDNGHGFDLSERLSGKGPQRGLGLTSMRERAELSGGNFTIESVKDKGTTIQISWPL